MTELFENLEFNNVYELLKLVNSRELYSSAISTYSVYYTEKDVTEKFITELNLIYDSENGNKLTGRVINTDGSLIGKDELKTLLIEILMSSDNEYSESIAKFFEHFENKDGKLIYTPNEKNRLKDSGIRNFLFELEVLELQKNNQTYQLNIDKALIFTEHVNTFKLSPELLCIFQQIKKEIGEKAELCVMDYEKKRLKNNNKLLNMLDHVALTDVNAGYDILSWEVTSDTSENIPRYIEVKAIQIENNSRFYWSSNEIDMARKHGDRYSLYLVPRIKEEFMIDEVRIIRNPSVEIFDSAEWKYKIENYSIWSNN